ncbi:hypothetical protein NYA30BAC_01205 [Halomonas sp. NYA30]
MGLCRSTSLIHRADLLASCYRMAGHLVMMEGAGLGGWMLVWQNPRPARGGVAYPGTVSKCTTSVAWHAVIAMGGVAAEIFQRGQWVDADTLLEESKESFGPPASVAEAAPDWSAFTLDEVVMRWSDIESYAQEAAEQWVNPLALEHFRIDRIFPEGGQSVPDHFQSACVPGQLTRAALVQSGDAAYHIPSEYRA